MKKIISIFALGLAVLLVSCQKEDAIMTGPVNEVNDLYTVPTGATAMSELTAAESSWSTDRRYFDLTFGNALSTTLVGYDALLAPGQYILGTDEIGKAILAKTKVNGKEAKEGFITVAEREGKYTITAQIDGEVLVWSGSLPFEADPAPLKLVEVLYAQSNKPNGVNSLTMMLSTGGIRQEWDAEKYQNVWIGEGNYLALDIYSNDGYLHDGNYNASSEGGVINSGEFGIGYDTEVEYWGTVYPVPDQGTCLWTVADGAATATKVTDGFIKVSSRDELIDGEEATIWTISWGKDYPVEVLFEGAIPALTKPKRAPDFEYTYTVGTPTDCTLADNTVVPGVKKNPITIKDADGKFVAQIELVLAEGETELEGTFVSTEYAHEVGQLGNGFDLGVYFGMDPGAYVIGSYYMDGETLVIIEPGQVVEVKKLAPDAYEFIGEGFDIKASGPDYVPGSYVPEGGEEGGDDVSGDVVLKLTSGLTYTMEDITSSNTDSSQNPLSGMTLWRVTVSDGSGTVAAFDLGTEEGSQNLAGTYTVMSYPNAVGKAGNGWGWLPYMWGGCYFIVDGNYYWIPSDSIINVSNNADGTLKIKFEGAIQNSDNSDGGTGGVLLNNIAKS